MSTSSNSVPKPFLKWVGGKRQLLPELLERVKRAGEFGRYHEPFVGGGALFFELMSDRNDISLGKYAFLSDNNEPLVNTYTAIKTELDAVIRKLKVHAKNHDEEYYYEIRKKVPSKSSDQAARIIYMNKTCYNGLYRENSKGEFNVPVGRYKNPLICDEANLPAVSEALSKAKIEHRSFDTVVGKAKEGDLVYFDPPYHPVSATASFTSYDRKGFGEESQLALKEVCQRLHEKGVKVIQSNSMSGFIKDLYSDLDGFKIEEVFASRAINSRADRRGKVSEVLIHNLGDKGT